MLRGKYLIGSLLALTSCSASGGNDKPVADARKASPAAKQQALASAAPAAPGQQAIPKGAQYTLFCTSIAGPLHVERSKQMRDGLITASGMPDWYVVHENERSLLYYGYYRSIADKVNDPKETERAQADRQKIDHWEDNARNRPFSRALFVELTAPDPIAKPEWNLVNANGAYTLQIGIYKGSLLRKEAAVEAVRAAREQGIEAYYLHGETASMVCIGAWPKNAMRVTDASTAGNNDPSKPLMVVEKTGDAALDAAFDSTAKQGDFQLVRQNVEILDPTMLAAMKQYQYNSVNGEYIMHQGPDGKQSYDSSQILFIPKKPLDAGIGQTEQRPGTARKPGEFDPSYRPPIPRQNDPAPANSNVGKLRSIP